MLFERHLAAPPKEVFEQIRFETPNFSGRMDNLRAAILRPQLKDIKRQCDRWNERYFVLEKGFRKSAAIHIPERPAKEQFVASSIQFSVLNFNREQIAKFQDNCAKRGVMLKWFGGAEPTGYTSRYDSWKYIDDMPKLTKTEDILETLMDMRIPLTFDLDDCKLITEIVVEEADAIAAG